MKGIIRNLRKMVRWQLEMAGFRSRRSFGLDGLDLKLLKYITRRGGFFVEAGGNNGLDQSNTAYLERYLGWRGILVEPIPKLAEICRVNRPRSIVEQCALVPLEFSELTVEMTYCNLMSLVKGARGSKGADETHLAVGRNFLMSGEEMYTVVVPARSLTNVLDKYGADVIDFLSLDVEGFEANVLRGLDFKRYKPRFILVEANEPEEVHQLLSPIYDLVDTLSHHDRLYRIKSEEKITR